MSTLLEQASLVLIPSGYKEDVVYSQIPTSGAGDLSFTRASNGTRVNSAGLVEVCPWNLVQQSNAFSTSPWLKSSTTLTSGQTDPNGGSNAWKVEFAGGGSAYLGQFGMSQIGVVTISAYFRADVTTTIGFNDGSAFANSITIGTTWQRYEFSYAVTAGQCNMQIDNYFGVSPSGQAKTFYIYGAQLNIGSTAKPYFPTTDRLNVPRLTYQNGGGGCPSLLLEKQSTNLALYSQQFDDAYWIKQNLTVTANSIVSPDGTQNADLLTLNTLNAEHNVYAPAAGLTITANAPYTFSCYVKKGTGRYFCTATYFTGVGFGPYATFDLNTATLVASGASFGTYVSSKIENIGNDWYRCSVTGYGNYSSLIFAPDIRSASSLVPGVPFTGAGETMYLWGAQLEASSYPTSLINTTSASATRVADACFKTGISSLIGQTEGTIFADINPEEFVNGSYLGITDGTITNRIIFGFESGSVNSGTLLVFGLSGLSSGGTYTRGQRIKVALAYKSGDSVLYVNGSQVETATNTFSGSFSQFRFDSYAGTQNFIGKVNESLLSKTRLSNSELQSLTTL
jgi:hypothetical protein